MRLAKVGLGWVMLGWAGLGKARKGYVRLSWMWLGQIELNQAGLGKVGSGWVGEVDNTALNSFNNAAPLHKQSHSQRHWKQRIQNIRREVG